MQKSQLHSPSSLSQVYYPQYECMNGWGDDEQMKERYYKCLFLMNSLLQTYLYWMLWARDFKSSKCLDSSFSKLSLIFEL